MRRLGVGKTIVLLITLVALAACTRSLSGPAPTAEVYQPSTPIAAAVTSTQAATIGETVIAAETATPIPTMTPTTTEPGAANATPTNTPAPAATATSTTTAPSAAVTPSANEFSYTVQTGDTLWGLAIRFGATVEAIKARNALTTDVIYKGQALVIPGTTPGSGQTVTHVVQPGENLFRIALKYGTTIEAISAANSIVNPALIYAGQRLTIPTGGTPPSTGARYHVVQPGETLSGIALKYGTTPWAIAAANGISNTNYIYAGQTLRIP